jgi:gas vesicle protein
MTQGKQVLNQAQQLTGIELTKQLQAFGPWVGTLQNPALFSNNRGTQNSAVKTGWARYAATVSEGCQLGLLRDSVVAQNKATKGPQPAVGAGKGVQIGCAIGGGAAIIQATQTEREKRLDAEIRTLQQSNQELEQYLASMKELIAENNRQIRSLEQRYKQGQIKLEEKQKRLAQIRADVKDIDETVAHLKGRRDALQARLTDGAGTPMTPEQRLKLNQELNRLGELLKEAEKAAAGIDRAALG